MFTLLFLCSPFPDLIFCFFSSHFSTTAFPKTASSACVLPQVRLTMETVAPVDGGNTGDALSTRKTKSSPPVSQLVRLLWGEDTAELQMSIGHIPHIVMYLSLKLDSASPHDEVS